VITLTARTYPLNRRFGTFCIVFLVGELLECLVEKLLCAFDKWV
jgi:hypothetical protein